MIDRQRVLAKLDELDSYLRELRDVAPRSYEEYQASHEKRRACERILHISIECVIDTCNVLVSGMRLGLPGGEEDLFVRLQKAGLISPELTDALKRMRAFRNILVHRYGSVEDRLVYEAVERRLGDFEKFKAEILEGIRVQGRKAKRPSGAARVRRGKALGARR